MVSLCPVPFCPTVPLYPNIPCSILPPGVRLEKTHHVNYNITCRSTKIMWKCEKEAHNYILPHAAVLLPCLIPFLYYHILSYILDGPIFSLYFCQICWYFLFNPIILCVRIFHSLRRVIFFRISTVMEEYLNFWLCRNMLFSWCGLDCCILRLEVTGCSSGFIRVMENSVRNYFSQGWGKASDFF